jgi:hypothetical protein
MVRLNLRPLFPILAATWSGTESFFCLDGTWPGDAVLER